MTAGGVFANANQISSAVGLFFRISDIGCEPTFGSLLFPSLSPSHPSIPHSFPSLEVGPLKSS